MDPLSAVASAAAILQLTGKVIEYLASAAESSSECRRCLIELLNLQGMLISLKDRVKQSHREPWFEQLRKLDVADGPLDQYKQALESLLDKVESTDRCDRIKSRFLWNFTKDQVAAIFQRIERLNSLLSIALSMDNLALSRAIKTDTETIRDSLVPLQDNLTQLQAVAGAAKADAKAIRDVQVHEKHTKILTWLSPLDFSARHNEIISERQHGTVQWFLDCAEFKDWSTGRNKTLLCTGAPGAGKSVLAAVTVDHLQRESSEEDCVGVAYVFCNYNEQMEQTADNLITVIAKQLLQSRPDLMDSTEILFEKHSKQRSRPVHSESIAILSSLCSYLSTVYVIVDALDECKRDTRLCLIRHLRELQDGRDLRLLYTSRHITEVTEHFQGEKRLEISARDEDVRCYVDGRLHMLPACVQDHAHIQEEVKNRVVEAVDGMFLLAKLYINSLEEWTTIKQVRAALANFKRGNKALESAYAQIIRRIESQGASGLFAKRVLLWISHARRPLSSRELCIALAIEPGTNALDHENLTPFKTIVSLCMGLVTADERSGIVRLVHYTAEDYLKQVQGSWNLDMGREIAVACVTYLSFDDFRKGSCPTLWSWGQRRKDFELFDYASEFVGDHVRMVESDVLDLVTNTFQHAGVVDSIVQALLTPAFAFGSFPKQLTVLHLFALLGLPHLMEKLKPHDFDHDGAMLNVYDALDRTPLYYASYGGHEVVVEMLLNAGATINPDCCVNRPVLQAVSSNGEEHPVDNPTHASTHLDCKNHGSPLTIAAYQGHEQVVKLLLMAGATIDGHCSGNTTALYAAARRGHERIVEVLLAGGANVDVHSNGQGTALFAAACYGHDIVVKRLIEAQADIDMPSGGDWMTPLTAASRQGHEEIVRLLLQAGARVDLSHEKHGTALHWAAIAGHTNIVKLLLGAKADVQAPSQRWGTPLQAACGWDREAVIRLLLDAGADVNAWDRCNASALEKSALAVRRRNVKALLEANTQFELRHQARALYAAAQIGDLTMVRLLLGAIEDAQVRIPDSLGRSLQAAASHGKLHVVQALLDAGADVNFMEEASVTLDREPHPPGGRAVPGRQYGTPLYEAASNVYEAFAAGCEAVVTLLLEAKADIHAIGGYHGTALQAASVHKVANIVALLRTAMADAPTSAGDCLQSRTELWQLKFGMCSQCRIIQLPHGHASN